MKSPSTVTRCFLFCVLTLLFASPILAAAKDKHKPVNETNFVLVPLNGTEILPVRPGVPIHISNSKFATFKDRGRSIAITGKHLGETQMHEGEKTLELQVVAKKTYQSFKLLRSSILGIPFLYLEAEENSIRLVGELLSLEDWLIISSKMIQKNLSYILAAKMAPSLKKLIMSETRAKIEGARLPQPTISFDPVPKAFISVADKSLLSDYKNILGPLGFQVVTSTKSVALEPMIETRILVSEIKKDSLESFGVKWPEQTQVQVTPTLLHSDPLTATLNALEKEGTARVLASPILLCRSGKQATFLAGGEVPIKIMNYKVNDVVWKKYGILLTVKPIADSEGRMSIDLESEVSSLNHADKVDGIPSLFTNRIHTHFDLPERRTIALSGLIKNEWASGYEGIPGLSKIPILGSLFSSHNFQNNRSELIVFVSPRVLVNGPDDQSLSFQKEISDEP